MPYCGRDHQIAHRGQDKAACNGVKKAQQELDRARRAATACRQFFLVTFLTSMLVTFGELYDARLHAPYGLVEAILKIKSIQVVQVASNHVKDMLHLCRGNNMGVRDVLPHLLLRLGRDQECYDFIKWWAIVKKRSDYDWDDLNLPLLDVKVAVTFDPVALFVGKRPNLSHIVDLTVMKIRPLMDFISLQNFSVVCEAVPQEVRETIRGQLVSNVVTQNG
jgi:hypothetical protein